MLEIDLTADGRELELAQRCLVAARPQMRDDPADLLQRHVPLGPQRAHHEQVKQVLVAVEPHRVVLAEAALDRGHSKAGLFQYRSRRMDTPASRRAWVSGK